MGRVRRHGLRCLLYAICVLIGAPVVIEFALRVQAFRASTTSSPTLPQPAVVMSPVMHHQLAPLQQLRCPTEDDTVRTEFRTNSLGLRSDREFTVPKPKDVFRIICIGDEVVLAPTTAEDKTFPQRLAARLQPFTTLKVEVINAAVPDFSPVLQAVQVRHQLRALQPDLIVAHFDISDPADNRRDLRFTDLDAQESPLVCVHPQLAATPKIKSACEHFLCINWAKSRLQLWASSQSDPVITSEAQRGAGHWLKDPAFIQPNELKSVLMTYDHLAANVEQSGARVMLVVHPWVEHVITSTTGKKTDEDAETVPPLRNVFTQFEQSTGILVCFLDPYLQRLADPEKALQSDHRQLTEQGHDVYSYAIAASILHRLPGPWNVPTRSESAAPVRGASHEELEQQTR